MKDASSLPIGIFDSGLGGLTVVKEIATLLPHEDIIYVGDTARVPYGTKSPDTIRRYAQQIAFFLLNKKVKAIVVACNTVSAVALKNLRHLPIPILGVIEPGARAAIMTTSSLRVGVIGTPATVGSHAYKLAINRFSPRAHVLEKACPLFVPLVEEGWGKHPTTKQVAREYLTPLLKARIDTLVLGCTHYPLLKSTLQAVAGKKVKLIDSAQETAKDVLQLLRKKNLLKKNGKSKKEFFVTDNPAGFTKLGHQFLGNHSVQAKRLSLENF
jgi:glutamate racemase